MHAPGVSVMGLHAPRLIAPHGGPFGLSAPGRIPSWCMAPLEDPTQKGPFQFKISPREGPPPPWRCVTCHGYPAMESHVTPFWFKKLESPWRGLVPPPRALEGLPGLAGMLRHEWNFRLINMEGMTLPNFVRPFGLHGKEPYGILAARIMVTARETRSNPLSYFGFHSFPKWGARTLKRPMHRKLLSWPCGTRRAPGRCLVHIHTHVCRLT